MGFLGKIFSRSFRDVDTILQKFDERISKVEGVHGNYTPKDRIGLSNVSQINDLDAPVNSTDVARYSSAMRSRQLSFSASKITTSQTRFMGGGVYEVYKPPTNLNIKRLWLWGRKNQAGAPGTSLIFSAHKIIPSAAWPGTTVDIGRCDLRATAAVGADTYCGTLCIVKSASQSVAPTHQLYFKIVQGNSPTFFDNITMLVDYEVVDK